MGRELGVPDLEAVGLAHLGGAALDQGRVEEGLRLLDEASAIAATEEFQLALSPGWTLCCTHHRLRGSGRLRPGGPVGRGHVQDGRALAGPPHERDVPQRVRKGTRDARRLAGSRQRAGGRCGRHRAHPSRRSRAARWSSSASCGPARAGRTRPASCSGRPGPIRARCSGWAPWPGRTATPRPPRTRRTACCVAFPTGRCSIACRRWSCWPWPRPGLGSHDEAAAACSEVGELAERARHHLPARSRPPDPGGGDRRTRRSRGVAARLRGRDRPLLRELGALRACAGPGGPGPGAAGAGPRRARRTRRPPAARETFVALGAEREVAAVSPADGARRADRRGSSRCCAWWRAV